MSKKVAGPIFVVVSENAGKLALGEFQTMEIGEGWGSSPAATGFVYFANYRAILESDLNGLLLAYSTLVS